MTIFAYDHHEIIMADRVSGATSVTACKNCTEKCTKNCLLVHGPLILHHNVRPQITKVVRVESVTSYSLDTSPPDFNLFPKLKQPMHEHRFPSLEVLSAAVTRTIRGRNKSGTLNGTTNRPECSDTAIEIEKQKDYIDGL